MAAEAESWQGGRKPRRGARPALELPIVLDRSAAEPLSVQLAAGLRAALLAGRARAGERLPSSRALAATLGVSRTVVSEAYDQLYAEGWLDGRHGSGTFVAELGAAAERAAAFRPRDDAPEPPRAPAPAPPPAPPPEPVPAPVPAPSRAAAVIDLRPGIPWKGSIDTPAWRRAWRLATHAFGTGPADGMVSVGDIASAGDTASFGNTASFGLPGLRGALTEYMRRGRGVVCPPGGVLVTRGATNGLDMLAATVLRPGDRAGVEEPGYPAARAVLEARGARVVPCPVDEHGLVVDDLPGDLRLVHTTPSHQYPLGGVLPVPRRLALIAWARRTGALIAEDDYDGEFRFDVAPLPALHGLDPEVVVYLGTTAKVLTADVGVGWLVARPGLVEAIGDRRWVLKDRTALVPQEAVRLLLERGDLDRHVRRMRAEYARRRAVVAEALRGLPIRGDTAGLHLVVELGEDVTERVMAEAARRGVLLRSLAPHFGGPQPARGPHGLVIGYGAARVADLRSGCSLVRELALR